MDICQAWDDDICLGIGTCPACLFILPRIDQNLQAVFLHSGDTKFQEVGDVSKYKYREASHFFKKFIYTALSEAEGSPIRKVMESLFAYYNSLVFPHLHHPSDLDTSAGNDRPDDPNAEMDLMLRAFDDFELGDDNNGPPFPENIMSAVLPPDAPRGQLEELLDHTCPRAPPAADEVNAQPALEETIEHQGSVGKPKKGRGKKTTTGTAAPAQPRVTRGSKKI